MARIEKARYWWAVLYPENMIDEWEDKLPDLLQLPFAYCKHVRDRDSKSEHRKDHVHVMIAFPNTTTYQHALDVFDLLSAEGKRAVNTCQALNNVRHGYDYLIHDTETCRQQKKEQYDPSERITGNNFDIGSYEQIGVAEKDDIYRELAAIIRKEGFSNFMDFTDFIWDKLTDAHYLEVYRTYNAQFERLTKANYQKLVPMSMQEAILTVFGAPSQAHQHAINTDFNTEQGPICCPECGSVSIVKYGKTKAESQRWRCNDCGKVFVSGV